MTDIRKVIKKIRRIPDPPVTPEPLWKKYRAKRIAQEQLQEGWETDKRIVRDHNFEKAKAARELQVEAIRAEKERKAEIKEQRLENLKKARKKLKRLRAKGEQ